MNKKVIGGLILLGGVGLLVLVSRHAKATEEGIQHERHQDKLAQAIADCGSDRQCVMRVQYAAQGRDWDLENDPEYRQRVREEAYAAEEERIRRMREDRWSHL